ncbi:hypothetical protein [[Mycoplasma] testudinis]|uniref:hypothetical protein n=1 Tax=[Mycoplasma] testudinis TaxID=33924 RepID=UPI0004849020|nr:hypothetical protein [[Mycoplasma] testudinis]
MRTSTTSTDLTFCNTTDIIPNKTAYGLLRLIMILFSVLSIVLGNFEADYNPALKTFLNFLEFGGTSIGLSVLMITFGYSWCSLQDNQRYRWKTWMKSNLGFFKTYYFYAILMIIVAWIALGILKSRNDPLLFQGFVQSSGFAGLSQNPAANSNGINFLNFGYPKNVNGWFGTVVLFSLIPTQNFFITGTVVLTTTFWFTFIAPFIFKWLAKASLKTNTIFLTIVIFIALFFTYWNNTFLFGGTELQNKVPGFNYVTTFTKWEPVVAHFILGFYIRKYLKLVSWKITLSWFIGLSFFFFVAETALDQGLAASSTHLQNNFDFFYLSANNFSSIPSLIMSVLILYAFLALPQRKNSIFNNFRFQKYVEFSNTLIVDQLALSSVMSRMFLGVVILHFGAGYDILFINNQVISIKGTINGVSVVNFIAFYGWIIYVWHFVIFAIQYLLSLVKTKFYLAIEKIAIKIKNHKQQISKYV